VKKLHKFILQSYLGPLILTFFIALFVLLMQWLWKYIDELVGKGLEWYIIAKLLLYVSTWLVPMALPLAVLLASIMTFGSLGEYNELTALKSSGISLQRILLPIIVLSVIMSIGAFYFSNHIIPYTNLKMSSLLWDVRQLRPELNIKEGVFFNGIDNYSIKIGEKNKQNNTLYDIMIYNHLKEHKGNINTTIADSGYMKVTPDSRFLVLQLYSGKSYEEQIEKNVRNADKKHPQRRETFEEQTLMFRLKGFDLTRTDENLFKKHYQMLNLGQLSTAVDSLKITRENRQELFYTNILKSNYFKIIPNRDKRNPDTSNIMLDTIQLYDKSFDIDSVFESLEYEKKKKAIDLALNYARSTNSYIVSSKKDLHNRAKWINRHLIEWHRKFSLSFACLVLFFIGAPLGAIIRKGGLGMPMVVSVLFFLLYYIISITGEKFVREGILPSYQGMWLSSVILLPLGIFLTYKATTDSAVLNIDTYMNFFKRIIKLKNKKSSN
jgi:lipopolysaccharide export system permease protein